MMILLQLQVLAPNLSVTLPSITCSNDSSLQIRVSPIGSQRLELQWSVPPIKVQPKSQRENLLLWRSARKLEKELNSKNHPETEFKINATQVSKEILPL